MPTKGQYTDADLAPDASSGEVLPPDPQQTSLLKQAGQGAADFGKGVLKGAGSTLTNIGSLAYPHWLEKAITGKSSEADEQKLFSPSNTTQAIGKGAEQVGEFFAPGPAEGKLAEAIPELGKLARPAVRMFSAEGVNEAQGGAPGVGAAGAGAGEAIGAGLRAAAPKLAEAGLRIRPPQRAFGKTPGEAILADTSGVAPETIKSSGQDALSRHMNDLETQVNQASSKPAPRIAGFLQPPREELPLAASRAS